MGQSPPHASAQCELLQKTLTGVGTPSVFLAFGADTRYVLRIAAGPKLGRRQSLGRNARRLQSAGLGGFGQCSSGSDNGS